MNGTDMRVLRARYRLSQAQLAKELGLGLSTIANYERGHTLGRDRRQAPIPTHIELACEALQSRYERLKD